MTTVSTHPAVLQGKDGWLFLRNDSNGVMDQLAGRFVLPVEFAARWGDVFEYRRDIANRLGFNYAFLAVPNKECVYQDKLPDAIQVCDSRPVHTVMQQAQGVIPFSYPLDLLDQRRADGDVFIKGDTHWNEFGAFHVFNRMLAMFGLPQIDKDEVRFEPQSVDGDLSSKLGERTVSTKAVFRTPTFRRIENNDVPNIGNRYVYENDRRDLPTCVVFRDSFSSHLLHFFAHCFRRVVVLWQPNLDVSVLEAERPDFVLGQQIERFLVQIPDDRLGKTNLEYAAAKARR